jgi:hypothetical protein
MYEKKLLGEMKNNYKPIKPDYESVYKLRTMGNAKGKLGSPFIYNNQLMEPIYYPLELPLNGEPIALPRIEIGGPMKRCKNGMNIKDLSALLAVLKKRRPPVVNTRPQIIYQQPQQEQKRNKKGKGGKFGGGGYMKRDVDEKVTIPFNKKKEEMHKISFQRDWWKLCRDFCNMYAFFSTGRKYAGFAKVRDNLIANKTKVIVHDITVLKEWIISITQSFWEEFKVFTDLNVSFKNVDSKIKITKESQKIIAMIRKFLENLISNSTKLIDIPERVQQILYSYIKDKAYFPKNYLTTYQINRIDYNFYGGTKNLQGDQTGMLLAVLVISGITVQQILLHMRDSFAEFKNYPNIEISAKFIGSIMHYLVRDTFNNDPTMLKEVLALMNYYRNYHIYNNDVEGQGEAFRSNVEFKDIDEFADYLVPEGTITEFWNLNPDFVDMFKNYVYSWATRLSKLIRLKFEKSDTNLLPKRGLERPRSKTYGIKENNVEQQDNSEDEQ